MKRRSPHKGGPGPAAVQSNQCDSTRLVPTQDPRLRIGAAWRAALDGFDSASRTVIQIAHSLAMVMECGSPDERDLAREAIDDIAMRRRLSPRQLAELLAGLWDDGDVLGINEPASSQERPIARSSGSDNRVLP
jgi:hypothetical protein